MKKIKDIDFNNKEVVSTEYHFIYSQKDKPDDWTIEDEIMMLSLFLQREVVMRNAKTPIHTLMEWRQNVSKAIHKTTDKLQDDNIFSKTSLKDAHEYTPWHESFVSKKNLNGNIINIVALNKNGYSVLTEAGKQEQEKEQMLEEAKELAKAELLAEQEEAQKQKEANQKEVVVPLVDYGK